MAEVIKAKNWWSTAGIRKATQKDAGLCDGIVKVEETQKINANDTSLRAPSRISSDRATLAYRVEPNPKALSHAYICAKHSGCKVTILVFPGKVEEGQEDKWRNCQPERGTQHQS